MSEVLSVIANTMKSVSGVDVENVTPDKHIFEDLGIDSLDFLDIVYDLDRTFGIKLPIEQWLAEVEQNGKLEVDYFVVGNLVVFVEKARAEQAAE
jgi:acyl carrier protein